MKTYTSQEEYYQLHKHCPNCGNDKSSSTYVGYIFIKDKPFKNENLRECSCGWTGITDDLV